VITEHSSAYARGLLKKWQISLAQQAFSAADVRVVVSPELGRILEQCVGSAVTPWQWLPNMVAKEFQAEYKPPTKQRNRFRVLNVGLMTENKGQLDLLEAFAEALRHNPLAELVIGGDGPVRGRLEAAADRLGVKDQVQFLGMLDRHQVREQMRQADVFVLSSHYETFGIVAIEALACGTPVIATRCGGPDCILNDGDGLLVPPRDPAALAAAMRQMSESIECYERASIAAACRRRFGGQVLAERLTKMYTDVLDRTKRGQTEIGSEQQTS
jgi:glycosyltransferase involved in cell wall biosynthesis